jgi:hypothetical protein
VKYKDNLGMEHYMKMLKTITTTKTTINYAPFKDLLSDFIINNKDKLPKEFNMNIPNIV